MADAFQRLPDSVASYILCKVGSIKWLMRCEAVCKRWNRLCTSVEELVFDCKQLEIDQRKMEMSVESMIWRILSFRSFKVRRLQILNSPRFDSGVLPSWLKLVSASLELLELRSNHYFSEVGKLLPDRVYFERLVRLSIAGYNPEREPSCFMPCLTICNLQNVSNGKWIEKFVELSPLLKEMQLIDCEPSTLRIASSSLEFVVFIARACKYMEIDAPRLLRLEMHGAVKLLLVTPALEKFVLHSFAEIEFCNISKLSRWIIARDPREYKTEWTTEQILKVLDSAGSITVDHIELQCPVILDVLEPFMVSYYHTQLFMEILPELKINEFVLQSLRVGTYRALNKTVRVQRSNKLGVVIRYFSEHSCDDLMLLLGQCEGVESVYVFCDKTTSGSAFVNKVLGLQKKFSQAHFKCIQATDTNSIRSNMR